MLATEVLCAEISRRNQTQGFNHQHKIKLQNKMKHRSEIQIDGEHIWMGGKLLFHSHIITTNHRNGLHADAGRFQPRSENLDLVKTSICLDQVWDSGERVEAVLVWSSGEVSDLSDVHS